MVYGLAPLRHAQRRALSAAEEALLERAGDRVLHAAEAEYEREATEQAPTRRAIIEKRLAISVDLLFSDEERQLLAEALEACAIEMDHGGDVNIHFNGDEYGVRSEHFRALRERLISGSKE